MPQWLPIAEAADAHGLTKSALDKRGLRGTAERKRCPRQGVWLYACPDPDPDPTSDPTDPPPGPVWEEHERYIFARDQDGHGRYIFRPACLGGQALALPETTVRALWSAYTSGATVAEICLEFALERQLFVELRDALRLTHTSPPWTPEEASELTEEELYQSALQRRMRTALTKAERTIWRRKERDAEAWRRGPAALLEQIRRDPPVLQIATGRPRHPHARPPDPFDVVVGLSDLHIGKQCYGKPPQSPATQAEELHAQILAALDQVKRWGNPRRIYVHVGGDLLHVDTARYTTTAGTPQGGQTTGSLWQIWSAAYGLMARALAQAAAIGPTTAVCIPGNHDWVLSMTIGGALEAAFADHPAINVDVDDSPFRVYATPAGVPLLFDHGNNLKPGDYPSLLAREMPAGCNISRGVVFRGHYHGAALASPLGVSVVTMPSAGGVDDWHQRKGYLHRGSVGVYRIGKDGLEGCRWIYAEEDQK